MNYNISVKNINYLAIDKAAMVACQSTKSSDTSILAELEEQFPLEKLHILNRIDQPVSGIMLVGKSKAFIKQYLRLQERHEVTKIYYAIVEGALDIEKKTLSHFHQKDGKIKKAIISNSSSGGSPIDIVVSTVHLFDKYTLVEVKLKSGKFHQIRAQLAHIGHPIKGDVKYGARRKNQDRYILLHAYSIHFEFDFTDHIISSPIPENDALWKLSKEIIETNKSDSMFKTRNS